MAVYAEWQNDWAAPYPFRLLGLSSEHDADLGQWLVTVAVLGLSVTLVWEYADTPLKRQLREQMADGDWLAKSHVSMPYTDYEAMKAAVDWAKANGWTP